MSKLLDLLIYKIVNYNPADPRQLLDLTLALILIIAFLTYFRRFPVYRVFIGVLTLLVVTILSFVFGLIFTGVVVGFGTFLVLISLPLIFAPEIRHYMEKLGRLPFLHIPSVSETQRKKQFIHNLVAAIYELAERNIGATLVLERRTGLGEEVDTGVIIDARFGSKLLSNIFFPGAPLHDGAVIIRQGRVLAAGCLLPVSPEVKLDPPFGTRHKAGLSLTRDTDAVVLIISEQRGEVSLAENGKLEINLERAALISQLQKLL